MRVPSVWMVVAFVVIALASCCGAQVLKRHARHTRPNPIVNAIVPVESNATVETANDDKEKRISMDYQNDQSSSMGGGSSDCDEKDKDCAGTCFGTQTIDCAGVCGGGKVLDKCNTCGGNNEACTDCNGDIFGTAKMDCGQCIGGNTGIPDATRRDCKGNCFGTAKKDAQGSCCYPQEKDQCGVCFGRDSCVDCNGAVNGTATYDECGVCSGGTTRLLPNADKDCDGVCFGAARIDDCNVCSGGTTGRDPNFNKDCNGVCFGPAKHDVCGVCDGDGSTCTGCDGLPNSLSVKDVCGVCKGDNSTCCGPFGNCNNRGTCSPSNGGECSCDLGWTGKFCTQKAEMCRWQDCGKHGFCSETSGECICDEGYMGNRCELSTCSFHGIADIDHNGVCNCLPGYTGADCSYCGKPSKPGTEYICITNYNQDINDMTVDEEESRKLGYAVPKPIKFTLFALEKEKVALALVGDHPLTISNSKMGILPGTSVNGTVYGCDCKPATPYEDSMDVGTRNVEREDEEGEEGEEKKDEEEEMVQPIVDNVDAVNLKEKLFMLPRSKFKDFDKYVKVYKRFKEGARRQSHNARRGMDERALTANEANTFLNELFAFFNEQADAFTDTPETVGAAVDNIQSSSRDEFLATLLYFSLMIGIILVLITIAIISVLFVTGGDIGGMGRAGYDDFSESLDYEETDLGSGGYGLI